MKVILHRLGLVTSTQTVAKQQLQKLPQKVMHVYVADQQTLGRGTRNQPWFSPQGVNIYATFCFSVPDPRIPISNISQVVSLAVAKLLEGENCRPYYKWPNDLLCRDNKKKYAGVLTETSENLAYTGIGLNVNMRAAEIPADLLSTVTSMQIETGKSFDREAILTKLSDQLSELLGIFFTDGFKSISRLINDFISTPKEADELQCFQVIEEEKAPLKTTVDMQPKPAHAHSLFPSTSKLFYGRAVGITPEGYLCFEDQAGKQHVFSSGRLYPKANLKEVEHVQHPLPSPTTP